MQHTLRLKADAITRVCRHVGCSRDELARRAGLSSSALWRADSGATASPSARVIAGLLHVSGLDFGDLFEVVAITTKADTART